MDASNALTMVFICIAIGGGIGASVVVIRHFGAKEYGNMCLAAITVANGAIAYRIKPQKTNNALLFSDSRALF